MDFPYTVVAILHYKNMYYEKYYRLNADMKEMATANWSEVLRSINDIQQENREFVVGGSNFKIVKFNFSNYN